MDISRTDAAASCQTALVDSDNASRLGLLRVMNGRLYSSEVTADISAD